jgi:hypothetical protein
LGSGLGDVVDGGEGVQGARVADEWHEDGDHIEELLAGVADVQVDGDVTFRLRVSTAEGDQHGEGEKLPHADGDPATSYVITEAVGGEELLEVGLVVGCTGGQTSFTWL